MLQIHILEILPKNFYTRHTFWSSLIWCINMKWIQQVLFKIQNKHYSVHRRTDGQGETSTPPFRTLLKWRYKNNILYTRSICMQN